MTITMLCVFLAVVLNVILFALAVRMQTLKGVILYQAIWWVGTISIASLWWHYV